MIYYNADNNQNTWSTRGSGFRFRGGGGGGGGGEIGGEEDLREEESLLLLLLQID